MTHLSADNGISVTGTFVTVSSWTPNPEREGIGDDAVAGVALCYIETTYVHDQS